MKTIFQHRLRMQIIGSAGLIWLMMCTQLAHAARLNDIRIWHSPDRTRIVLDLDTSPQFKQFHLSNPSRFVVDLPGFTLNANAPSADRTGKYLKSIRLGKPSSNTTRVVLDLNQAVTIKAKVLPPVQDLRYRLVVDVYPKKEQSSNLPVAKVETKKAASARPTQQNDVPKSPSKKQNKPNETLIIAIDAGHGGEDSGARGQRSYEKKLVLQIAKRLKKKIDAQKGLKAILTRKGDYFIPLRTRTSIAKKAGADLFISIHADGFKKRSARGSSVYALSLSGASSTEAKALADSANAADLIGGVELSSLGDDLAKTIVNLQMNSTQHESISFASSVLSELKKLGKVHNTSVEKAGFVVLKSPDIPSILVETAFITNPREERLLGSRKHQEKLANAILAGAKNYLKSSTYHQTTAFSQ